VQKLLPYKSVIEVKSEVERIASILGKGGGYIMSPTNKIGPDVPLENILAIYQHIYQ
jgi:uroporphyrinogen-III decarboxylase